MQAQGKEVHEVMYFLITSSIHKVFWPKGFTNTLEYDLLFIVIKGSVCFNIFK